LFRLSTTKLALFWGSDAQAYTASTAAIADATDAILGWGVNADTAKAVYLIGAATEEKSITVSGTGANALQMRMGGDSSGTYSANIRTSEHIAFSDMPTTEELTALRAYLNARYAL
jgi:hypothetical protein